MDKWARIAKIILKKNKEGIIPPDLKTYYKTIVMNMVCYWGRRERTV